MCKLLAIVDIEDTKLARKYADACVPTMSAHDRDGVGIMTLGAEGLGVRRWLNPSHYGIPFPVSVDLYRYEKAVKTDYTEMGVLSKKPYAIAVHTRMATTEKVLENVHPFYKDGSALMHNGVISNHKSFPATVSTCDSEAILTSYLDENVRDRQENISACVSELDGWFACIVFNENGLVDIFKDERTGLFVAHVHRVGTVFATTEGIIRAGVKKLKLKLTALAPINGLTSIRWQRGHEPSIVPIAYTPKPPPESEKIGLQRAFPYLDYGYRDKYVYDYDTDKDIPPATVKDAIDEPVIG